MKNREMFVDIARGITILLMIIGHSIENGMLRVFIFSFHMPLFIILSGMFNGEKSLKIIIKNSIKKLFLPYLFFTAVVNFFSLYGKFSLNKIILFWLTQTFYLDYFSNNIFCDVLPIGVMWFIPFIINVRIIFRFLQNISSKNNEKLLIFCCILTCIGIILGLMGYYLLFSLDIVLACMLFYYVGYILYSTKSLDKVLDSKIIIFVMGIIWIIGIINGNIEIALRIYPNFFAYLAAICGSLVVLKFCKFLEKKKLFFNNFFAWCGKNSLCFLLIHHIEKELLKTELLNAKLNNSLILEISVRVLIDIIGVYFYTKISKIIYIQYLKLTKNKVNVKEKEIEKISCN